MQKLNLDVSKVLVIHSIGCDRIVITIDGTENPYKVFQDDLALEFTCTKGNAERYLKENLNLVADEIINREPNTYKFGET